MQFTQVDEGYMIRLERGEEVLQTVTTFAVENCITAGIITGLGAADKIRVGYFDLHSRDYPEKTFSGELEILALNGNLSWIGDQPMVHMHVVFSDENMNALGGHLFEARISATCEIYLKVFSRKLERKRDEETGLNLLDLK